MPRTYLPSGNKRYKKHDDLVIETALNDHRSNNCPISEVAKKWGISKSMLYRHNSRIMKKRGGQTAISTGIENYIVENLNCEVDYTFNNNDIRPLIKGYLDQLGVTIKRFRDNLPGPDYVKSFLQRNKSKITLKLSPYNKRCRAEISSKVIKEYFKELEKSLVDIALPNIVNFDEINLSDDPKKRQVVSKRGAKYPEHIMNNGKVSNSIMLAGSADGKLLPCYVLFKSVNYCASLEEPGPQDCRYNQSNSGWFDSNTFEDWVNTIAIPYFEKLNGKKVLIGDSLFSHLSANIIRKCKEKDIHFIFLPANSIHLTQPLHLALFRTIKTVWRDILLNWKNTEYRNIQTLIPNFLKVLLLQLENKIKLNMQIGFFKAGIIPLNKDKVLQRLPEYSIGNEHKNDCKEEANQEIGIKTLTFNKKTIIFKPGQIVCVSDDHQESSCMSNDEINNFDDINKESSGHNVQNKRNKLTIYSEIEHKNEYNNFNRSETMKNQLILKSNNTKNKKIIGISKENKTINFKANYRKQGDIRALSGRGLLCTTRKIISDVESSKNNIKPVQSQIDTKKIQIVIKKNRTNSCNKVIVKQNQLESLNLKTNYLSNSKVISKDKLVIKIDKKKIFKPTEDQLIYFKMYPAELLKVLKNL